jgi:hypothetical protein
MGIALALAVAGLLGAAKLKGTPPLGAGGFTIAGPVTTLLAPGASVTPFDTLTLGSVSACVSLSDIRGNPTISLLTSQGTIAVALGNKTGASYCAASFGEFEVSCDAVAACQLTWRVDAVRGGP